MFDRHSGNFYAFPPFPREDFENSNLTEYVEPKTDSRIDCGNIFKLNSFPLSYSNNRIIALYGYCDRCRTFHETVSYEEFIHLDVAYFYEYLNLTKDCDISSDASTSLLHAYVDYGRGREEMKILYEKMKEVIVSGLFSYLKEIEKKTDKYTFEKFLIYFLKSVEKGNITKDHIDSMYYSFVLGE